MQVQITYCMRIAKWILYVVTKNFYSCEIKSMDEITQEMTLNTSHMLGAVIRS